MEIDMLSECHRATTNAVNQKNREDPYFQGPFARSPALFVHLRQFSLYLPAPNPTAVGYWNR